MHHESQNTWQTIKKHPPGKRFELLFRHRRQSRPGLIKKIIFIGGGIFFLISGIVFLPTPIPGIILLFIGCSLIAQESLIAARILDLLEIRVRNMVSNSTSVWYRSSLGLKIILSLFALSLIGVIGFRAVTILFSA